MHNCIISYQKIWGGRKDIMSPSVQQLGDMSPRPILKLGPRLALTVASLHNHVVLHARCNCPPLFSLEFDASPGKWIATVPHKNNKTFP